MTRRLAFLFLILLLGALASASLTGQRMRPVEDCMSALLDARVYAEAARRSVRPNQMISPYGLHTAQWMQAMTEYHVCVERRR